MIWLATAAAQLLAQFWRPIAATLAALGAYLKGRSDAAAKAKHQADEHAREALEDRAKVEDRVTRLPDRDLRDELRKWRRP